MTTLTNDQITAAAAVLCDHGQPIGRNAAIEVADAMQASGADYTVDDSELARKIMVFLGQRTSGSMEPGADPLRDRLAERIALWRPAPSPQIAEKVELPPLKLPKARMLVGTHLDSLHTLYSAEQVQAIAADYARDAIAASRRAAPDVDDLAQFIRKVDGNHSMGAGALAERITEWLAAPAPASAGQAAPEMIEQYGGPWPTVEMTVAGKRMLEKQTSIEHIKKYSAGIANSIYEAMHAASPVGIAAQPAEGAGQASQGYCADCNSWGGSHKGGCQRRPERFFGAGQAGQVAKLPCPQCGVDRLKAPCPGMAGECAMIADAHLIESPTERAAAPARDRPCTEQMRGAGLPAPRTCPTCGLGPCKFATHQPSAQVKP